MVRVSIRSRDCCFLLFVTSLSACLAAGMVRTLPAEEAPAPSRALLLGEAGRALADGLPQVAAVKAEALLTQNGISTKDMRTAAGFAVECWIRADDARRALDLISRHEIGDANYWKARACLLLGDVKTAEELLESFTGSTEMQGHAQMTLAYVYMVQGREAQSRRVVKELREHDDPVLARHARLLFNELELAVDRNQVVMDRLAREQGGKDGQVQFLRAKGWLQLGDMAKAEAVCLDLKTLTNLGDHLRDATDVLLAEILLRQNKPAQASEVLIQFLDGKQDTDFWDEAFRLLAAAQYKLDPRKGMPLTVVSWMADSTVAERQAHAMFLVASWLVRDGRPAEAAGLLEALLQSQPGYSRQSDAMRLAMQIHGELRADDRVLMLAKEWKEKYGGGGESLVEFMTGNILFARGDFKDSLDVFRRSAELSEDIPQRRRALYNAAAAAIRAGEAAIYHALVGQLQSLGESSANDKEPAAPGGGDSATDLELDRALQMAAESETGAELELQRFVKTHPGHKRLAEAHVAIAELSLLDVPSRVKSADLALQAAAAEPNLTAAMRERIDYVRIWLREAEADLARVASDGLAFLKKWPSSALAEQVRMKVADAYFRLEDYPNARTQFELLVSEHPDSPFADAALYYAGRAAMAVITPEGLKRAIEIWETLAEKGGPLAFAARLQQAQAMRREGSEDKALALINSLLQEPGVDDEIKRELQCERIELLALIGRSEPKWLEEAARAARIFRGVQGLSYLWKARAGVLLERVLHQLGQDAESLETCYDVVNEGLDSVGGPANPTEFLWFYQAGFDAVALLEAAKQWESAARMAERIGQTAGDRATEAKEIATRIRLEHFLWDERN